LPHERRFANPAGTSNPDKLFFPFNGAHGVTDYVCTHLRYQGTVFS